MAVGRRGLIVRRCRRTSPLARRLQISRRWRGLLLLRLEGALPPINCRRRRAFAVVETGRFIVIVDGQDDRVWMRLAMHGRSICLVQPHHPVARATDLEQIHIDLHPPGSARSIIRESHIAKPRCSIQRSGRDDPWLKLETQHRKARVVDKRPRRIPQGFMIRHTEEAQKFVENSIRLLQLQIEAERLE